MSITNREFSALLKRAARLARESADAQRQLGEAFVERYGAHYSDIDADEIIDAVDYSGGERGEE